MLCELRISNYALIDELTLSFDSQFNVITGETGAGKSILLGAIGLILGNRFDNNLFFNKDKKCIVEGIFKAKPHLSVFFEQNDLDFDENIIVRREIALNGKSRAFINDTPVNLDVLKEFSERMIDIHDQHQQILLNNTYFQLSVLDTVANNRELLDKYKNKFTELKQLNKKLDLLTEEENKINSELDYFTYQYNELLTANIDIEADSMLDEEFKLLANSDKIKSFLQMVINGIEEGEFSIIQLLQSTKKTLNEISPLNARIQDFTLRFENIIYEIKDLNFEIRNFESHIDRDEKQLNNITTRIDTINNLLKKHKVSTLTELKTLEKTLKEKISGAESLTEEIEQLKSQIAKAENTVNQFAKELSESRKSVINHVEHEIVRLAGLVGMPKSRLKIELLQKEPKQINEYGIDKAIFTFSSNPGIPLQAISKAASGGELSRLMLCIKTLLAGSNLLSTLFFDEIDQGVSGETALQVGTLLNKISQKHQVFCITHLPQIAAQGKMHFLVSKEIFNNHTLTKVMKLSDENRINELAKMIGGNHPPQAAIDSAKLLLNKNY